METEMKDKNQLEDIKGKIEKILEKRVVEIKCLVDDFTLVPRCFISITIDNGLKGKLGFFIDSFEDVDFLNNAIKRTCNSLKKELV